MLGRKYGQKYMGAGDEDIFRHTSVDADKGPHEVPVENFLNAQCMCKNPCPDQILTSLQTSAPLV